MQKSADEISNALLKATEAPHPEELDESILKTTYEQLTSHYDEQYGGFGQAPKFPTPHNFLFLLRYWKRTGNEKALEMVEKTLQSMRLGGIYDQIGFGFHRYSTDSMWLVPHFEKMLYDQAMLAMAYTEAYQATKKEEYKKTAKEIFTYVLQDMTSPERGFYSTEDADSEGEEGKFYLWSEDEIRHVLGNYAEEFIKTFNIEKDGNFIEPSTGLKTGMNILHLTGPQKLPEEAQQKLFVTRKKRIHPHKDDKILTDWNGLMIAALAKASQVFDESVYSQAAKHAADFILKNMRKADGRLLHRYRDGHAAIAAYLDDYAFMTWGLIELYEATFEVHYLKAALELNSVLLKHSRDKDSGGFYFTADDSENLLIRQKEIYDGAIPSGNSVAMLNLLQLARMTANSELEHNATLIMRSFSKQIKQLPSAYTFFMMALDIAKGPSYEVVITGNSQSQDTKEMLKALRTHFIPNKIVLFLPSEEKSPAITQLAEYTKHYTSINNKATAYVCQNYNCTLPTTDIDEMLKLLR